MIGIIIVSYKTVEQTVLYVQRELCKISTEHRIVIVNVACNDETNMALTNELQACIVDNIDSVIDADAHIFILPEPENIGYARGNNLGAGFFNKHFEMDYYLISNNDLEFIHGDVVEQLIKKAEKLQNVGAIGPKVIGEDGRDQSPAKKMSIWKAIILPNMFYPLLYPFLKKGFFEDVVVEAREGFYAWISGAFFIVNKNIFKAVNGFDPGTFLYAEEIILSERMLNAGFSTYYLPSVSVLHKQEQGSKKEYKSIISTQKYSLTSKLYYYKKYCGTPNLSIMMARLAVEIFNKLYLPVIILGRNIARKL
ncbi:MAG: glycosyltransferase family 2 protein [Desulfobacteraceae bacterium]|jgi:GT2 family glycosyltransferase